MRILVLSKRQYMGKDLLDDRYGRFYELPLGLAEQGHAVHGLCASYRPRPEEDRSFGAGPNSVRWRALHVPPYSPPALLRWLSAMEQKIEEERPDAVWACSDAFHAIAGVRLQRRLGVPCVVDLYDNFEAYPATRVPGVKALFRRAVRNAAGVTCVSEALSRYVQRMAGTSRIPDVLENGISEEFGAQDRAACRAGLGLPQDAAIVGTVGALDESRDIGCLLEAFTRLSAEMPALHLLLAGVLGRGVSLPRSDRVHYLGQRPLSSVPAILGAMDVAVVCNRRSAFGEYCFPQKFYEILACGVPLLAADTAGLAPLLEPYPRSRYEPGSASSLKDGIRALLSSPSIPPLPALRWRDLADRLSGILARAVSSWH